MSAIVDFTYYAGTYKGNEADQTTFPALYAHASRMIAAMTRWQVSEDNFDQLPALVQTQYKLAICSQVDYLGIKRERRQERRFHRRQGHGARRRQRQRRRGDERKHFTGGNALSGTKRADESRGSGMGVRLC